MEPRIGEEISQEKELVCKMKCRIVFADERLRRAFEKLKNKDKLLYKWLNRALDDISENSFCGVAVPKRLIPKIYMRKYGVDKLWKYDLPKSWRLLYSVGREEIRIIAVILEWLDYRNYERRFKY